MEDNRCVQILSSFIMNPKHAFDVVSPWLASGSIPSQDSQAPTLFLGPFLVEENVG